MVKDLNRFLEKLDTDHEFKSELRKALELYPEKDVLYEYSFDEQIQFVYEVVIPFARKHGFDFNLEDIIVGNDEKSLDDDFLEEIAGGVSFGTKLSVSAMAAIQALTLMSPAKAAATVSANSAGTPNTAYVNKIEKKNVEEEDYGNVLDVLKKSYKSLHPMSKEYPINEVDGMIFATLAYLPMNCVPNLDSKTENKEITISEWCQKLIKYLDKHDSKLNLHSEDEHNLKNYQLKEEGKEDHELMCSRRIQMLETLSKSPRYKNIKIGNFKGKYLDTSHKDYEQFAAVTFTLEDGTKVVSFRGTDGTLSGWREDLDLSWSERIRAQTDALKYLESIYHANPDSEFILTGHSKGGHLAIYSSFYLCSKESEFQNKLKSILNYDGPGLRKDIVSDIDSESFDKTSEKLTTFIPQSSIIGRIMSDTSKGKFFCVYSSSKGIFYQHDSLTWTIHKDYENSDSKFKSYEIQPESEFSAGAISMFLDAVKCDDAMHIFVDWVFDFMHNNNIEIDDKRSKAEIFKDVFYNYFIRGKSLSEIVDVAFAPNTVINISEAEQKSFKQVMKAVFKAVTRAYWSKHLELNKKLGFSPELNESIEEMVDEEYSIKSITNVIKVVVEKTLSLDNIWKFIKKLYS
ncbi:MAG: DUF2974 domain-containing protein [Clostridia bacterium]|nr:DUF2974 domain-containing protein [Clostridia bacterium]